MRCEACSADVSRWSSSPLCPACFSINDRGLPFPAPASGTSATWLWTSAAARGALATGELGVIVRAYRSATGMSQRGLAEQLGYDPTYISMIENGRREVSDVATRLRFARYLGLPAHTLGLSEPDDADFTAMLQFGESTIRLAVVARQSGHGAEAVNELWPLVTRLERRAADGYAERDVMVMLARARAELGVSLGYVLPEERLASAARWTGRALRLAEYLDDQGLLAFALRVHGNELRKVERPSAAVARLHRSITLTPPDDRGPALVQLARAAGELGDPKLFDQVIADAWRHIDSACSVGLGSEHVLREVQIRGFVRTGRPHLAADLLNDHPLPTSGIPPQWQAIMHVTTGEALLAHTDIPSAAAALRDATTIAEAHRLPHQIQRVIRASTPILPAKAELGSQALSRIRSGGAVPRRL